MVLAWPATLLMLLNAIMAVLIVDLARFLVAEDLVGFSYLNKFLVCCLIAT